MLTRRRQGIRNNIRLSDGSYLVSELLNTDRYTILWINRNIRYMRLVASISFDFGHERATYEIEELKQSGGHMYAVLRLGENWEEAEWLVEELRRNGWKAQLIDSTDKAYVKVRLKPSDVIYIERVKLPV